MGCNTAFLFAHAIAVVECTHGHYNMREQGDIRERRLNAAMSTSLSSNLTQPSELLLTFPTTATWTFLSTDALDSIAAIFASFFSVDAEMVTVQRRFDLNGANADVQVRDFARMSCPSGVRELAGYALGPGSGSGPDSGSG